MVGSIEVTFTSGCGWTARKGWTPITIVKTQVSGDCLYSEIGRHDYMTTTINRGHASAPLAPVAPICTGRMGNASWGRCGNDKLMVVLDRWSVPRKTSHRAVLDHKSLQTHSTATSHQRIHQEKSYSENFTSFHSQSHPNRQARRVWVYLFFGFPTRRACVIARGCCLCTRRCARSESRLVFLLVSHTWVCCSHIQRCGWFARFRALLRAGRLRRLHVLFFQHRQMH